MLVPHSPGQRKHAHFLVPASSTTTISPFLSVATSGKVCREVANISKCRILSQRSNRAIRAFISAPDHIEKWVEVGASPILFAAAYGAGRRLRVRQEAIVAKMES